MSLSANAIIPANDRIPGTGMVMGLVAAWTVLAGILIGASELVDHSGAVQVR